MKELKIEIPIGYEIDKEKSTFEKIVFKKKENTKPRNWQEYFEQYKNVPCYELGFDVSGGYWNKSTIYGVGYCAVPSKELAESFLAMMKLMSLRQAWIGDWKPDWSDFNKNKWGIINYSNKFTITLYGSCSRPLSFPTKEIATDFMNCFKDLLEVAKPLI